MKKPVPSVRATESGYWQRWACNTSTNCFCTPMAWLPSVSWNSGWKRWAPGSSAVRWFRKSSCRSALAGAWLPSSLCDVSTPFGKSHRLPDDYLFFYNFRLSHKDEMLSHHIPIILVAWHLVIADAVFDIGSIYGLYSFHICMWSVAKVILFRGIVHKSGLFVCLWLNDS